MTYPGQSLFLRGGISLPNCTIGDPSSCSVPITVHQKDFNSQNNYYLKLWYLFPRMFRWVIRFITHHTMLGVKEISFLIGTEPRWPKVCIWISLQKAHQWYGPPTTLQCKATRFSTRKVNSLINLSCSTNFAGIYKPVLIRWGDHYWMVEFDMDCSYTKDGWFETKSFVYNGEGNYD